MADTPETNAVTPDEIAAAVIHPGALRQEGRGAPVVFIDKLSIALPDGADRAFAVDRVSFKLFPGEMLCVVGESGSGKSMSANALMGLLPDTVRVAQGRILLNGEDLVRMPPEALYAIRGRRVAMVFQEPMSALNPLMKVSAQIEEVFEAHGLLTPKERKAKALSLLTEVGLPDPARAADSYPFQLSGGQRQRVMIAMALACKPKLLIADEPTTALDVTTQAEILDLIARLQKQTGMAVLFITHDMGVVAQIADDVLDITSDAETMGKATGKDAERGKATLVGLHGLDWAEQRLDQLVSEAVTTLSPYGEKAATLIATARYVANRTH